MLPTRKPTAAGASASETLKNIIPRPLATVPPQLLQWIRLMFWSLVTWRYEGRALKNPPTSPPKTIAAAAPVGTPQPPPLPVRMGHPSMTRAVIDRCDIRLHLVLVPTISDDEHGCPS